MKIIIVFCALVAISLATPTREQLEFQVTFLKRMAQGLDVVNRHFEAQHVPSATQVRAALDASLSHVAQKRVVDAACQAAIYGVTNVTNYNTCVSNAVTAWKSDAAEGARVTAINSFCSDCVNSGDLVPKLRAAALACTSSVSDLGDLRRIGSYVRSVCAVVGGDNCLVKFWESYKALQGTTPETITDDQLETVCRPCTFRVLRRIHGYLLDNGYSGALATFARQSLRSYCTRQGKTYCVVRLRKLNEEAQKIVSELSAQFSNEDPSSILNNLGKIKGAYKKLLEIFCDPCVKRMLAAYRVFAVTNGPGFSGSVNLGGIFQSACLKDGGEFCLVKLLDSAQKFQALFSNINAFSSQTPPCQSSCDDTCRTIFNAVKDLGCCAKTLFSFIPEDIGVDIVNQLETNFQQCDSGFKFGDGCNSCIRKWTVGISRNNTLCDPTLEASIRQGLCASDVQTLFDARGCATWEYACSEGVLTFKATGTVCSTEPFSLDVIKEHMIDQLPAWNSGANTKARSVNVGVVNADVTQEGTSKLSDDTGAGAFVAPSIFIMVFAMVINALF